MAIVNEVITRFSFLGSLKKQESFNLNLRQSIKLLAGFGAGIGAASGLMYRWTNSVAEAIDPTIQLSRETGEAIETIQALGYAASVNGSSLDAVQSSLRETTKRMGEFVRTGGGPAAEVAIQLGLNLRKANGEVKSASGVMLELNDKMARFSRAEQSDILDKLGIDASMIQLLNQSDDAISSLMQRAIDLGVVNKQQADQLAAYNDANTTFRFGLKSVQNQIAIGLTPVLMDLIDGFTGWLSVNRDLIANIAGRFGNAILSVTDFIGRMKGVIAGATAAFVAFKLATGGLGKVLAVAFSPVTLITAGIVAAVLAIDDLIVAFNGGQSVIRDFIKEWTGFDITPALQDGVAAVKEFGSYVFGIAKEITGAFGSVFSGIWKIWNGDFKEGFKGILDGFTTIANGIVGIFSGAFSFIKDQIAKIIPDWIKNAYNRLTGGSTESSSAPQPSDTMSSAIDWGRGSFGGGIMATVPNVSQSNEIKIYSNDPTAAGQAAADFSSKQIKDAASYFNRGGK